MLQRKMMLGYNKANYLMEEMEKLGVVGQFNGAKPRKVLINSIDELNAT
jgi:S-DNA-T family DNA segregation ATPase FtsK/SpoIIIE